MKHIVSLLLLGTCCQTLPAQKIFLNGFIGAANYQGDLQAKRFTYSQARFAFGVGASYEVTDKFFIRSSLTFGRLTADDKKYARNADRNLNFTTGIKELQVGGEYYLLNPYYNSLSPYIFGGIAIFHYNPWTRDTSGNKVYLKPLSTEGEGFYPGRKNYNLTQFALPFGAGVKLSLSENVRVGVEVGLRKTFTDYLDDVSTNYVDQTLLLANRGAKAVELAYRGDELKSGGPYPPDGTQRGGPKYKDWYYFSGVTISYRLGANKYTGRMSGVVITIC